MSTEVLWDYEIDINIHIHNMKKKAVYWILKLNYPVIFSKLKYLKYIFLKYDNFDFKQQI